LGKGKMTLWAFWIRGFSHLGAAPGSEILHGSSVSDRRKLPMDGN